jgi:hypothetical protein
MTKYVLALTLFASPLLVAGSASAGANDGPRPLLSSTQWLQAERERTRSYALTGREAAAPPRSEGWTQEVQRLGNKVKIIDFQR